MHAERLRGRVFMYELPPWLVRMSEKWMWRQWGKSGGRGCDPVYNRRIYAAQTHFDAHLMHDDVARTLDPSQALLFYVPLFLNQRVTWGADLRAPRTPMVSALEYVKHAHPWWNASGGRNHVWFVFGERQTCLVPPEIAATATWFRQERTRGQIFDDVDVGGVVWLTFANSAFRDFAINWAAHVYRLRKERAMATAALDVPFQEALRAEGLPFFGYDHGRTIDLRSDVVEFRRLGALKGELVLKVLRAQRHVLLGREHVDLETISRLREPRSVGSTHEKERSHRAVAEHLHA